MTPLSFHYSCEIFGKMPDLTVLPLKSSVILGKLPDLSVTPPLSCVILGKLHKHCGSICELCALRQGA